MAYKPVRYLALACLAATAALIIVGTATIVIPAGRDAATAPSTVARPVEQAFLDQIEANVKYAYNQRYPEEASGWYLDSPTQRFAPEADDYSEDSFP